MKIFSLVIWGAVALGSSAFAEGVHSLAPLIGASALMVRGGNELQTDTYPQVVAVIRRYKERDEKTQQWVEKSTTCTGSVFNQSCVLLSSHCFGAPNEITLDYSVHTGLETYRWLKEPVEGGGREFTLPFRPQAMGEKAVPFGEMPFESYLKWKPHLSEADIKKLTGQDIGILKLKAPLPAENSFTELNLPAPVTFLKGVEATIVGYGVNASNYDDKTRTYQDVGAGVKRDGTVVLADSYARRDPVIVVNPTKNNNSAGPGDSGGPLLLGNGPTHGRTVIGVVSNIDATNVIRASFNRYVSTLHHRDTILSTLKELDCVSPQERLRSFLNAKVGHPAKMLSDWKSEAKWGGQTENLATLKKLVRDTLVIRGELPPYFDTVTLGPVTNPDNLSEYHWDWQGAMSGTDDQILKRREELKRRNEWIEPVPRGVLRVN